MTVLQAINTKDQKRIKQLDPACMLKSYKTNPANQRNNELKLHILQHVVTIFRFNYDYAN